MASSRTHSRNASQSRRALGDGDDSVIGAVLDTRQLEAFGRKVTATASHLMGDNSSNHYPNAMTSISRQMRRPALQRGVLSFSHQAPSELVRAKLSTSEIAHRALTYISDDQLHNIPEDDNTYSLFQGFQASVPENETEHRKGHRRRGSKQHKLLGAGDIEEDGPPTIQNLKKKRNTVNHKLEMMAIRKNMCTTEIRDIDNKIANMQNMRRLVLDRLAGLENDEAEVEHELLELDNKIEEVQEELAEQGALEESTSTLNPPRPATPESEAMDASFMSQSIYEKLPSTASPKSPKSKRRPTYARRKSMPVLHEHLEQGSHIKTVPAHNDTITALDFDQPFGTMVSAALDDTVRVWDLNLGRCMGFLEGHTASVRCLQVENNIVATGGLDATIRLWDLSRAKYEPYENKIVENGEGKGEDDEDDGLGFGNENEDAPPPPPPGAMEECPLFVLEAHVDEVTALHLRGDMLVSGSADKTLRQWDLVKGRCVQTLDVLWAAAQASATLNSTEPQWRPTGRATDANADFVGALQCFDAALACGTADGMVRLWDLRSGQVHRSLVGHTGPVTCLQFDDTHLVTASVDRSVRIWDLRTGTIFDAYGYDAPITSMMFDARHIVCAAGEDVVKVYDKADGRHWDCGVGANTTVEDRMADTNTSVVEHVRLKDGYLIEGRRNGEVGVWTC
ncbi:Mitochondrial fission protein [Exophiala xenobiotica]|uniref:Mitochondrial division protein 1 n=1 Tax=Vermiconidia calcicola TaxID=1690605 RepID=A0AAV9PU95_9PEZI|nr:Mitochondrial fission protein [Exophiala xenobiotica]KAK5528568.1 Mitochondrial fission protein [Vermiconidia calcicola]KAK5545993.1 Mitochondrial fission protein [Chaetothyriales sp. CCFEE 6169]KAK5267758.1 Mitochondrial fission protein [Exophiala xenobiotica]KAK5292268.1 Mitochondrial fission protein [Exophiala xenobiotica]